MTQPPVTGPRMAAADEAERLRAAYSARAARAYESWKNPAYRYMRQERARCVLARLDALGAMPLAGKRVLDVGCGTGNWIRDLVDWGATPELITGIDLLPERLEVARASCPAGVRLSAADASSVKANDGTFDIVIQSTVFSSVPTADARRAIAAEMLRLVRPDGLIIWYDVRVDNPRNRNVHGIARRELAALFPECEVDARRITLAPPIARALAPLSELACHLLARIPVLCTHYLAIIRPLLGRAKP